MFETMEGLTKVYPEIDFHIVIGMDNANVIEAEWDRGEQLIQKYPFIVLQRPGVKAEVDWFAEDPHVYLTFRYAGSSESLRKAIRKGDYAFARRHLSSKVWDYIVAGKLYGYKEHADG
jgi:nicotinic acid mononucleotide adenylyltransferase